MELHALTPVACSYALLTQEVYSGWLANFYVYRNTFHQIRSTRDCHMHTLLPEELYPLLAVASWCSVGAGGLLASNGFCVTELVEFDVPKGLIGEGPVLLGWGRAPRESRSTRRAFSPRNWSSTLLGCVRVCVCYVRMCVLCEDVCVV